MDNVENTKVTKKADTERRTLPNCAFDMEYQTERYREVKFLAEKGINYTFVRKTRDYGVSQYKYTKTPALFAALVEFYSLLEAEKAVKAKKTKKPALEEQEKQEVKDDTE